MRERVYTEPLVVPRSTYPDDGWFSVSLLIPGDRQNVYMRGSLQGLYSKYTGGRCDWLKCVLKRWARMTKFTAFDNTEIMHKLYPVVGRLRKKHWTHANTEHALVRYFLDCIWIGGKPFYLEELTQEQCEAIGATRRAADAMTKQVAREAARRQYENKRKRRALDAA